MIIMQSVGLALAVSLGISLVYTLTGMLCSIIPKNKGYRNVKRDVEIFVVSNGVHIDFLVPAISPHFDWTAILNDQHYQSKFTEDTYLGIGWGDKGFYLDIPTWADLTPKVAMRAMLIPSRTLMHITAHAEIPKDQKYIERIHLDVDQYMKLCDYISSYFKVQDDEVILLPGAGYTPNDNFYEANGAYHALNTCNFWVNRGLIVIGVRTPVWTHWDKGVFYQLKKSYP